MKFYYVESNHFIQSNPSKYCGLYAIANILCNYKILAEKNYLYKDGGMDWMQASDLIRKYKFKLLPLYFSRDMEIRLSSTTIFNENEWCFEELRIIPMLCAIKKKRISHMISIIFVPKYKKFIVVDSLLKKSKIYFSFESIINDYHIHELSVVTNSDFKTGFYLSNTKNYLSEILKEIEKRKDKK